MAIYMQLAGVQGNATNVNYKNWITLQNIHWGLSVDVSTTVGDATNRMSAGKITPSEVSIHKEFDKASVPLMLLAFAGKPIGNCIIAITQQASDAGQAYLTYTLSDVIISSFQVGASDSGNPSDSISLNFAKLEVVAASVDEMNTGASSPVRGGYNFGEARPL